MGDPIFDEFGITAELEKALALQSDLPEAYYELALLLRQALGAAARAAEQVLHGQPGQHPVVPTWGLLRSWVHASPDAFERDSVALRLLLEVDERATRELAASINHRVAPGHDEGDA